MKKALVLGAGGFIGNQLVKRLKSEGYWVRGVDLKYPEFSDTEADDFIKGDLTDLDVVTESMKYDFDEVYQLAADMGGAGYIFTGNNDANVMHNSALINLHVARQALNFKVGKVFYSSSACMYPEHNQLDPDNPNCSEESAYPANPDSEYGWEKLFSERMYLAFKRNYGLDIKIARFHNIFGVEGTWTGGKEKAPAAFCRKVAEAEEGSTVEIWGDGKQTRSFLYIDECLDGVRKLMDSDLSGPYNIGSEEMVSMNEFAEMIIDISGKKLSVHNLYGEEFEDKYGHPVPLGVKGRNSDNNLIKKELGWSPTKPLRDGISKTYNWICKQMVEVS